MFNVDKCYLCIYLLKTRPRRLCLSLSLTLAFSFRSLFHHTNFQVTFQSSISSLFSVIFVPLFIQSITFYSTFISRILCKTTSPFNFGFVESFIFFSCEFCLNACWNLKAGMVWILCSSLSRIDFIINICPRDFENFKTFLPF